MIPTDQSRRCWNMGGGKKGVLAFTLSLGGAPTQCLILQIDLMATKEYASNTVLVVTLYTTVIVVLSRYFPYQQWTAPFSARLRCALESLSLGADILSNPLETRSLVLSADWSL